MNKVVLTVDDDASIRMLIKSALRAERSVDVVEACDGLAGLEAARTCQPDLVILDVVMPRQNGIETLMKLRADPTFLNTPVIMLTAVKDNKKLNSLLAQSKTDFMAKPFMVEMLRKKVREALFPDGKNLC